MIKLKAYLNLDSLFDVRLGCIAKHSGKGYKEVFLDNVYRYLNRDHNRLWEYSDCFSKEDYLKWYVDRDTETLKLSPTTDILEAIATDYQEIQQREENKIRFELLVDIQHYTLSRQERNELRTLINLSLPKGIKVTMVRCGEDEFTPKFVSKNFNFVYSWDFDTWWGKYHDELLKNPMGDVMWFAAINAIITQEEQNERINEIKHDSALTAEQKELASNPIYFLHALLVGYVDVNLIPLRSFSIGSKFIVSKENKE